MLNMPAGFFNLQLPGNIYGRLSNPTTAALEQRIAALEGGVGSTCCSSGHAAQMIALLPLMEPGRKIVASTRLYGGTITQFSKTFERFGWSAIFVDTDDKLAVEKAVSDPDVRLVFAESLANPGGVVSDIAMLAEIAHDGGVPLVIDSTMATPALCRPIDHGADIVVHSTTKFLSGHGNAMGGAVVDSGLFDWAKGRGFPALAEPEPAYHGITFYETFGPPGLHQLQPCGGPKGSWPDHGADECVFDPNRHGNLSASDACSCGTCDAGCRVF
jgi:O-acetylhomoserine sulfhydrylase